MITLRKTASTALLTALALGAVSSDAGAVSVTNRSIVQLGTGPCAANNPANDPQLRRLPTGLKNSGAANVSVVCSQWGDDATIIPASAVYAYFKNDKAVETQVVCTLTMGVPYYTTSATTKSVTLAAGAYSFILWDQADYGTDVDKQWANLQCSLPQAVTLREIVSNYVEETGT